MKFIIYDISMIINCNKLLQKTYYSEANGSSVHTLYTVSPTGNSSYETFVYINVTITI